MATENAGLAHMSQRAITQLEPGGADPDGFVRESNIDLGGSHGPRGM